MPRRTVRGSRTKAPPQFESALQFGATLTPTSHSLPLIFTSQLSISLQSYPLRVAMSNPFSDNNPPPLPPKQKQSSSSRRHQHSTQQPTRSNTRNNDPSHAHHTSRSTDTPSRTRPTRSQTTGPYVVTSSLSFPFIDIPFSPLLATVQPPIRPLVPSLPRRGVPILLTRPHRINRNHTAQKPRRLPCTPMSLIVSILLVSDRVCLFQLIQLPTLLNSLSA